MQLKIEGHIARITIDNPPVNALSDEVLVALADDVEEATASLDIRAIVLTSKGEKAFAAGADLDELGRILGSPEAAAGHLALTQRAFGALSSTPLPVVAAVQANAVGGGLELALRCDFVIVEEHVRIGLPETGLGLIPGAGGTEQLTRVVGPVAAKSLLMLGTLVSAPEAWRFGLVTEVCATGRAVYRAIELADQLAARSPAAITAVKRVTDESIRHPERGAEVEAREFLRLLQGEDAREGCAAFLEKRRPSFGRRCEGS